MNETDLKLNPVHAGLVSEFLRLSKYQQSQRLKSVDHCFMSVMNFKIRDDETYSADEVKSILENLQEMVEGEVETELSDCVHTNVLLVQQLLAQAEEWHLTLTANISELENREKLTSIKMYDENLRKQPEKMNIVVTRGRQTVLPLEDMNVASNLKKEIIRLVTENDILKNRLQECQTQSTDETGDEENSNKDSPSGEVHSKVSSLSQELENAQKQIETLMEELNKTESSQGTQLETVRETVEKMSLELESSRKAAALETENLKKDLESREIKLRQVQSNLLLTEKELEKKFQATGAYANMKKILVQKNGIIKNLRQKLEALGGNGDSEPEEVLEDN